ncbi:MAG: diacylglycerol kinase [Candidatus Nomurabacteria bacterium]|nr:MAG: diacylglycerol kinase [Candidatus Nomurabacteria bacterium]
MSFLSFSLLRKSFRYAIRGLRTTWQQEQNFRVLTGAVAIVILFIIIFPLQTWEIITLLLICALILILELLNSAFEKLTDIVEPRIHTYVQMIKDIMAGAVLIASFVGLLIVALIVLPHVISLFNT